jgi:hypothetical protein
MRAPMCRDRYDAVIAWSHRSRINPFRLQGGRAAAEGADGYSATRS